MQKDQFINYIISPETLKAESLPEMADIISRFPYFQTAHLLYSKILHTEKNILYDEQLGIASAFATDRRKLYELLIMPSVQEIIKEATTVMDLPDKKIDIAPLEKEILKSAISASIAMEAEDELKEVSKKETSHIKEKHSFNDWLKLISKHGRYTEAAPAVREFYSPENMARMSIMDDEKFVTETLAAIYLKQKHFKKAINAYQLLIVKYPEKSSIFAAAIKKAEEGFKEILNPKS